MHNGELPPGNCNTNTNTFMNQDDYAEERERVQTEMKNAANLEHQMRTNHANMQVQMHEQKMKMRNVMLFAVNNLMARALYIPVPEEKDGETDDSTSAAASSDSGGDSPVPKPQGYNKYDTMVADKLFSPEGFEFLGKLFA